jgi:hypothetical protein
MLNSIYDWEPSPLKRLLQAIPGAAMLKSMHDWEPSPLKRLLQTDCWHNDAEEHA